MRMPTSLRQCYLTMTYPSKIVADSVHPNKQGLWFSICGFILISANIFLVVKLLPTFFPHMFLKKPFIVWCISHVVNTHCSTLSDVCNQQRT